MEGLRQSTLGDCVDWEETPCQSNVNVVCAAKSVLRRYGDHKQPHTHENIGAYASIFVQ